MVNKFMRPGSVTDEQRTGRPAVANETVQRIQEAIYTQPLSINQKIKQGTWNRTHHCVENTAIQIEQTCLPHSNCS